MTAKSIRWVLDFNFARSNEPIFSDLESEKQEKKKGEIKSVCLCLYAQCVYVRILSKIIRNHIMLALEKTEQVVLNLILEIIF
jgi:hypothetical protein